jgi:hypothetical protein
MDLTRGVQDLSAENYEILREVQKGLVSLRTYGKDINSFQVDLCSKCNPNQNSGDF